MDIHIGDTDTARVQLDVSKFVSTRGLVCANSGGGKSYLLRLIAERASGSGKSKCQVVILDHEGEFKTLRSVIDPLLLVGDGGETPTQLKTAALLAKKLMETSVSAVIDLSDLKLPARREYVRTFLDSLMSLPKSLWHPAIIMIDEAHLYCAQQEKKGKGDSVADSVIYLMSAGRKRGYCGVLATQRISKLHKDAIAETNNVFIGRQWLDNDQQRSAAILGIDREAQRGLRDLAPGQFYAFGPALSVQSEMIRVASVISEHPDPSRRHKISTPPATASIKAIVDEMGDLPSQVEEAEDYVKKLEGQIAQLNNDLRAAQRVKSQVERITEQVQVPYVSKEMQSLISQGSDLIVSLRADVDRNIAALQAHAKALDAEARSVAKVSIGGPLAVKKNIPTPKPVPASRGSRGDGNLSGAERKILSRLAQYADQALTKQRLAILSGYSHKGGGFNNPLGSLRTKGYAEGYDTIAITQDGMDALGDYEPLPLPGPELLAHWLGQVGGAERKILTALAEVYPASMSKEGLAQATGYSSNGGGFNNPLGKLRTLCLIEGYDPIQLSSDLMGR